MSFIGSMLNNSQGAGYQATGANVQVPVTTQDAQKANSIANTATNTQRGMLNQLPWESVVNNQQGVFDQQQALAQQLQLQAMGQGPNPVQAMLAQNTMANTANQAALMAGQRGAGANSGLIARQAAMQGSANQQQMTGQAATLGAQQQLAAQQMLAQQQQSMGALAGQQVGQKIGLAGQFQQGALGNQANLLGAIANSNNAAVGNQSNVNSTNGSIAGINANGQWGLLNNVAGGAAKGMALGAASGGMVPCYADGGMAGPTSDLGKSMSAWKNPIQMSSGAMVPGKASEAGDSSSNDTVPAMLSPGEIVIPRSIVHGKNAPEMAAKFVAAILAKKGLGK